MKIYLLYSNPFDEGDNIYGAFSSEEKADKAKEILSKISTYELNVSEIELDELEKYFENALSGCVIFGGHCKRYDWAIPITYGEWEFLQNDLDSYLEEYKGNSVFEQRSWVYATIRAKSKEEAIATANKILEEKKDNYLAYIK